MRGARWWAAVPQKQWPKEPARRDAILRTFDRRPGEDAAGGPWYGDRRQELVFIGGSGMRRAEIVRALEGCLLRDDEWAQGPLGWSRFPDPLPVGTYLPSGL